MSCSGVFGKSWTVGKFKKLIADYKTATYQAGGIPSPNGLLLHLGLGVRDMEAIQNYAMNGNEKYVAVVNMLNELKFEYEYQLEQILLLQDKHKLVGGNTKYNYNNTVFLLKSSNPKKYGVGKYELGGVPSPKAVEKFLIPKNESGVELVRNKNS